VDQIKEDVKSSLFSCLQEFHYVCLGCSEYIQTIFGDVLWDKPKEEKKTKHRFSCQREDSQEMQDINQRSSEYTGVDETGLDKYGESSSIIFIECLQEKEGPGEEITVFDRCEYERKEETSDTNLCHITKSQTPTSVSQNCRYRHESDQSRIDNSQSEDEEDFYVLP